MWLVAADCVCVDVWVIIANCVFIFCSPIVLLTYRSGHVGQSGMYRGGVVEERGERNIKRRRSRRKKKEGQNTLMTS